MCIHTHISNLVDDNQAHHGAVDGLVCLLETALEQRRRQHLGEPVLVLVRLDDGHQAHYRLFDAVDQDALRISQGVAALGRKYTQHTYVPDHKRIAEERGRGAWGPSRTEKRPPMRGYIYNTEYITCGNDGFGDT